MKHLLLIMMAAAAAISFTACGETATNAPANAANTANANGTTTTALAPTKEALLELDKNAYEAWAKGDATYFERILSDKVVIFENGVHLDRAAQIKMVGGVKCDFKSWAVDEAEMARIDDETYALTYKHTADGTCTMDGTTEKVPSPNRGATVWARSGDRWLAIYHSSTPIVDPDAKPAAADAAKKEEPKKDEAAPAKPTPSANTEALVKLHTGGWEAWRANDAKWFNEHLTDNAAVVEPTGQYVSGKAELVKMWTDATVCEGVTKVTVEDGVAFAMSPTLELLTLKGQADGKCGGQANSPIYQSAFYVKEGDAWKLAFMFGSPAR